MNIKFLRKATGVEKNPDGSPIKAGSSIFLLNGQEWGEEALVTKGVIKR